MSTKYTQTSDSFISQGYELILLNCPFSGVVTTCTSQKQSSWFPEVLRTCCSGWRGWERQAVITSGSHTACDSVWGSQISSLFALTWLWHALRGIRFEWYTPAHCWTLILHEVLPSLQKYGLFLNRSLLTWSSIHTVFNDLTLKGLQLPQVPCAQAKCLYTSLPGQNESNPTCSPLGWDFPVLNEQMLAVMQARFIT